MRTSKEITEQFSQLWQAFNEPDYTYILSMDIGWEDQNSFVIGAYHEHDKQLLLVR